MGEKIYKLTKLGKLLIFVVWVCNSLAVAMIFWCVVALTLGFGGIWGILMAAFALLILEVWDRMKYELPINERRAYNLYSTLGAIVGQIVGFLLFPKFPFVSLSPDSPSPVEVCCYYGAAMIVFFCLGRVVHSFVARSSKKEFWR